MPAHSRTASGRSLRVTPGFREYVLDQLSDLGSLAARSMFGGVGLYCDGLFFAIIARDVLYLKTDDVNRPAFVRAGMKPFKPYPDRPATMQYYRVPLGVLENAPELVKWARGAVSAARRAAERVRGR
jgi:DNA transformation protein